LRRDLKAAKIEVVNADGEIVDFHALRTTYVTTLILRGLFPNLVKELARHKDIQTTMKFYVKLTKGDVWRSISVVNIMPEVTASDLITPNTKPQTSL
jgi:integrase